MLTHTAYCNICEKSYFYSFVNGYSITKPTLQTTLGGTPILNYIASYTAMWPGHEAKALPYAKQYYVIMYDSKNKTVLYAKQKGVHDCDLAICCISLFDLAQFLV